MKFATKSLEADLRVAAELLALAELGVAAGRRRYAIECFRAAELRCAMAAAEFEIWDVEETS